MSLEQIEKNLNNFVKQLTSDSNIKSALKVELIKSVQKNFETGGRPDKWKPSKKLKKDSGNKTLIDSGAMSNVMAETEDTGEGLKIILMPGPNSRAYASIHQEGGVINMPARTMRFKESKKTGRDVFASRLHKRISKETLSKPYRIDIPARPYLVIPEEDYPRIINAVKSAIKL